jgi:proline racemase
VTPSESLITATDYHTAGEPFRIVTSGVPPIPGTTILEKRRYAAEHLDQTRQLLVFEPRGHADMYGCFVTDGEDAGADLGVVFFHNAGYSTACGHGTIALVTWALESGRLPRREGANRVVVDAPSGRLETVAMVEEDRVSGVRFRNVPAFVHATNVSVDLPGKSISCDIAFGGAFYASVQAADVGCEVTTRDLPRLIEMGRTIKSWIEATTEVVHPLIPELRDVYGVIFFDELGTDDGRLHQRNVTIFADGEVDRSPCGSGTSARLAILDANGQLATGSALVHDSIIGTTFIGRVVGKISVDDRPAVVTEVEGSAHITGHHQFILDPDDALGTGFLIR